MPSRLDEIEDWELEAYADGSSDARLDKLVPDLPELAARIEKIRRDNGFLRTKLSRIDCPSVDELRLFQSGFLDDARASAVDQHLSECLTCDREVKAYAQLEPRPGFTDVLDEMKQTFHVFIAQLLSRASSLIEPGLPASTLPVLRGSENDHTQTEFYGVLERNWQIALTQTADDLGYKLSGQLSSPNILALAGSMATLLPSGEASNVDETSDSTNALYEVVIDDVGWFVFHDVNPGIYTLWLEVDHMRVQIADLKIGLA